ncbi:MAG: phenylalanine--tRNA ligase subunit beta [bacterium]
MRVPIGWLKEFVEITVSAEELAERLTMAGLEVGEIITERFGCDAAVVGVVETVEKHPSREDFFVITADVGNRVGARHALPLLTNLPNFSPGDLLPLALEGFVFPDGSVLEPKKIHGVTSEAKIIAEADLELSDKANALIALPASAKAGDYVADLLGITETVLKFDLTANRGDCLSIFGIAREAAAALGAGLLKSPYDAARNFPDGDDLFAVEIQAGKLCPRYTGRVITDVRIGTSPLWMRRRLMACGMRPINNIVDVTNYVMIEVGQPLHAFDLDMLKGGRIIVRRACRDEQMRTLDGEDRSLTADMLVIADEQRPVAIAGVMGGADTEVTSRTSRILLESAFFDPVSIRRTSHRLELRSESSSRFEKVIDLQRVGDASDRAASIIHELGWGTPLSPLIDAFPRQPRRKTIMVSPKKINAILGTAIKDEKVESILKGLQFPVEKKGKNLKVDVPSHRHDISIVEDFAEEVARVYGYDRIPSELPVVRAHRAYEEDEFRHRRRLREAMVELGLDEAFNFSFTNRAELEKIYGAGDFSNIVPISNPLTDDFTHLRPSLIPALIRSCVYNFTRGSEDVFLFELGRIFYLDSDGQPAEKDSLAFVITGQPYHSTARSISAPPPADYFTAKGIVENLMEKLAVSSLKFLPSDSSLYHPHRSAMVTADDRKAGEFGELHPSFLQKFEIKKVVCMGEFEVDVLSEFLKRSRRCVPISRFPLVERDLSFVVDDEITAGSIREITEDAGGELLESVAAVDEFRSEAIGAGKKSVTFNMKFRHISRTLSDEEVNARVNEIVQRVNEKTGGILRL